MKILFWVPYPTQGASNRYRVEQYLPYLKNSGIEYVLHSFWCYRAYKILYSKRKYLWKTLYFFLGTISRVLDVMQLFRYDIVFIHREAYPIFGAFFEIILSMFGKPYIFDFDDAIFLHSSSRQNYFIETYKKPGKVESIIRHSRAVIAGNKYLADFTLKYNSCVDIIPTPIDTYKYFPVNNRCDEGIVIGWIGSTTTLDFLDSIRGVFIHLSKQYPKVKFKVVGGEFKIPGLTNIISKPWSMEDELKDLSTFDVGIMPMPDNEWTRGKCGFKAILCMSMGVPCVCSPVGINKEIIDDEENGFLATSQEEWVKKLSLLIENQEIRLRMGKAARISVENKYSLENNFPKFLNVLNMVYDSKKQNKTTLFNRGQAFLIL